ncbi:MAG: hypothetical protein WDA27_11255 [Actinomycetota bacterium]
MILGYQATKANDAKSSALRMPATAVSKHPKPGPGTEGGLD